MTDLKRILVTGATGKVGQAFILIGGDAALGHFFYPHPVPVTETQPHSAYPGCYALSKVLEEVMAEQYGIQYGLNVCCLRAPWVMEKDDFRYQLSFGVDVFGGPRWRDLVGARQADAYAARSRGLPTVGVRTPYHSTWLDNSKAKFLLGWRPRYDLRRMADDAWSYRRAPDDPRVIWYPG